MWTSLAFFRCPRLHPVVTVKSESPSSRPQSLQLSDIIVLLIQLPKKRHRVTEQSIPSKTQPRTARNYITHASMRWLKFLPHEHAFHVPPRTGNVSHTPHAPATRATRAPTRLLSFTYCHVSPRVTSHCHVSTHQPLTVEFDQTVDRWPLTLTKVKTFQQDLPYSVFRIDSEFELRFCI